MNCEIRECVLADTESIFELNRNEMGYDYSLEETKRNIKGLLLSAHDKIYVAVVDDVIYTLKDLERYV